ncbi:hypothetical protein ABIA30_000317 [Mycobacterium sp. MAA66]|jgi:hypothetical protein
MSRFRFTVAATGVLIGMAVAGAGAAGAATPSIGSSAGDAVNALTAQGYSVQLSSTPSSPLSDCTIANINTLSDAGGAPGAVPVAYVDVTCPTGC